MNKPIHKQAVVCAAIKMNNGDVILGIRHFSPDMRSTLHKIYGQGYSLLVKEQGFIDNTGNFLTREEAWNVAEKSDQIRYDVSCSGTLYSENLY